MALPFSRSTTYLPGGIPSIKSQDLNDMQDAIGGLFSATKSIIGLKIDGVGNQSGPASPAQLDVGQAALSDAALAIFRDQLGHVRSVYDHLGFPAGRLSEYRENWDFSLLVNTVLTFGSIFGGSGYSRWNGNNTNSTRNRMQTSPSGGLGGTQAQVFFNAGTAGDIFYLYGQYPWVQLKTYTSLVMEFEVTGGSPVGANAFWGLVDMNSAGVEPSNSTNCFGIGFRRDTVNSWQMIHGDGTTLVYTDLGIAVDSTITSWNRVRLELHGSGSPYGACARVFFNDSQAGSNVTTNIPTAATLGGVGLTPQIGIRATASCNATAAVGPLRLLYNRVALSSPSV